MLVSSSLLTSHAGGSEKSLRSTKSQCFPKFYSWVIATRCISDSVFTVLSFVLFWRFQVRSVTSAFFHCNRGRVAPGQG